MTSITSLPPELLLQVFHWATYDHALFEDRPSWRNYELDKYDGEDPWPRPSSEADLTAWSLTSTCRYWRELAMEFELRHITVFRLHQLDLYLERIGNLGQAGENAVECPVRRITLTLFKDRVWTEKDTTRVVSLIRVCPNLEVLMNWVYASGEMHAAGPIILESIASACPKLKRLHWKTTGCIELLPSQWQSILSQSALARSLEALEIDSPPAFRVFGSPPPPVLELELPALRCLQVNVNQDYLSLVTVIAEDWKLPSLTSLYLKSTHHPTVDGVINLVKYHGARLETLAMDESTSNDVPPAALPPTPVQDLMFHTKYRDDFEKEAFPSLLTLAVRFAPMEPFVISRFLLTTMRTLRDILDHPQLKEIVVLEPNVEIMDEPHPLEWQALTGQEKLLVRLLLKGSIRLVNRRGVELCRLIQEPP